MNKIIKKLYVFASENDEFYTEESKILSDRIYSISVANMSSIQEKDEFYELFVDYSMSVEYTAFEIGFKMALELLK